MCNGRGTPVRLKIEEAAEGGNQLRKEYKIEVGVIFPKDCVWCAKWFKC